MNDNIIPATRANHDVQALDHLSMERIDEIVTTPNGGERRHLTVEQRRDEQMQIRRLEVSSFAEAITLLLLVFVAVPLKHFAGYANATRVMGPIHGLAFLTFVWLTIQTVAGGHWSRAEVIRLVVGATVPFGGFINLPWLARRAASLG